MPGEGHESRRRLVVLEAVLEHLRHGISRHEEVIRADLSARYYLAHQILERKYEIPVLQSATGKILDGEIFMEHYLDV